jgi:hypothetical protein
MSFVNIILNICRHIQLLSARAKPVKIPSGAAKHVFRLPVPDSTLHPVRGRERPIQPIRNLNNIINQFSPVLFLIASGSFKANPTWIKIN